MRRLHPDQARADGAETGRRLAEINDALDIALAWTRENRAAAHRATPAARPACAGTPDPHAGLALRQGPAPGPGHDHATKAQVAPRAVAVPEACHKPQGHDAAMAAAQACFLEARRIFAPGPRVRCLGIC